MKLQIAISLFLTLISSGVFAQSDASVVISPRSTDLSNKIEQALSSRPASYKPRTEHLTSDGSPQFTNRLILENSPYLIQHAHNPVDWYPWGPEAFAVARRENKPIFLSIGYSTCHWCHVMEKESFENLGIANILNQNFIAIKVDRERRPDVDKTYMNAVTLLTGSGGWPMSSFLTPDGKPFHGGTCFPPKHFRELALGVAKAWSEIQPKLMSQSERVAEAVARMTGRQATAARLSQTAVIDAVNQAMSGYDSLQGGFAKAPKFPQEPLLFLLLAESERSNNKKLLQAVEVTLDGMQRGGIYDQLGGGFHRYSTDNGWLVPHFEKMLYNQAHLARVYLLAWRITGNPVYRRVATQTIDYVLRDMTSSAGAFFSATDADSEDSEGIFFIWTRQQIRAVLSNADAELAIELFGISEGGNFEGSNILHLPVSLEHFARRKKIPLGDLFAQLDRIREQLYQARELREHPLRDEKILTGWNGMMISTLAQAAVLLDDEHYQKAAIRAADFVWQKNRPQTGELLRVHLEGDSSIAAQQQDYAYFSEALIHVYDATGDPIWLHRAREIADGMLSRFWDKDDVNGGFYMSPEQGQLTAMGRLKDSGIDNAIPSGSSVALRVLQMLAARTDNLEYDKYADATLAAYATIINQSPSNFGYMLSGAADREAGELSAQRYIARGGVRAKARQSGSNQIVVDISIPPGWHINSDQPLQKNLIPTRISILDGASGWRISKIKYPESVTAKLGFQSEALSLYQGKIQISIDLDPVQSPPRMLPLELSVQACNDRICLPPEKASLRLPVLQ
jgi:uncharacterized protein YyaL (SSP411 family)